MHLHPRAHVVFFSLQTCPCEASYRGDGRDIYSGHSTSWEGGFVSKVKNREEFKGGLEKRKRKGGKEEKKKRVIKHTLKYLYEA